MYNHKLHASDVHSYVSVQVRNGRIFACIGDLIICHDAFAMNLTFLEVELGRVLVQCHVGADELHRLILRRSQDLLRLGSYICER